MDPESKKLLEKTFALAEENNKLLHKVRGVQKREMFFNILKYVMIIGITLGTFYFLEPYITKVTDLYTTVSGSAQNVKDAQNNSSLQDLLKNL